MQGSDCIRLRVLSDALCPLFVSFGSREETHKEWMLTQCSNKATMASLNQEVIARIPLRTPVPSLVREFRSFASDVLRQSDALERQSQRAARARDLLLPRPDERGRARCNESRRAMITDINNEDRLVQQTVADHLEEVLGWDNVYAFNAETFGPQGTLGRASEREVVLVRDLRRALEALNPEIPPEAREQAIERITRIDFARSLIQHNREFHGFIRHGVPVEWRDASGEARHAHAQVIDFRNVANNRFLAVRELKVQGRAGAALQPARGSGVLRERPAVGLHRAQGGLPKYPRGVRRQPDGLLVRAQYRPRVSPQRFPGS